MIKSLKQARIITDYFIKSKSANSESFTNLRITTSRKIRTFATDSQFVDEMI